MTVIDFQESDLPTRLRNDANHPNCDPSAATLEREAATEIERLTTENETLRAVAVLAMAMVNASRQPSPDPDDFFADFFAREEEYLTAESAFIDAYLVAFPDGPPALGGDTDGE